jgi:hypothetical protein
MRRKARRCDQRNDGRNRNADHHLFVAVHLLHPVNYTKYHPNRHARIPSTRNMAAVCRRETKMRAALLRKSHLQCPLQCPLQSHLQSPIAIPLSVSESGSKRAIAPFIARLTSRGDRNYRTRFDIYAPLHTLLPHQYPANHLGSFS